MIYTVLIGFLVMCAIAAVAAPLLFRCYVAVARRVNVKLLPEDQSVAYPFV